MKPPADYASSPPDRQALWWVVRLTAAEEMAPEDHRTLEEPLLDGEALFDVVADGARPFRVLIDRSEIRVLGTRFNVYRKPSGDVLVTVLNGAVEVQHPGDAQRLAWKRVLTQNEQLDYSVRGT